MSILQQPKYSKFLLDHHADYPTGRYVNLIIIRKTQSEAIFRTEGSGEPLCREFVQAGVKKRQTDPIQRVVITKRKQTAVERRTGREDLRKNNLPCLNEDGTVVDSSIDAYLYGFAVGQGGARRSRVITEDAFSVLSTGQVLDRRTSNALYETGTMRDISGKASESLFNSEYVRPETHFLDIETLKDVTPDELFYVLGNILRSSRYGAIATRIGKVKNTIAQIIFSDTEIFSTLELTQGVYDVLTQHKPEDEPDFPLSDDVLQQATLGYSEELIQNVIGRYEVLPQDELNTLLNEVKEIYQDPQSFFERLSNSYGDI
ncbi:type I-D CRISPR-associated protein Cas7/Csc2 [Phormidium tenue]|jgi:CRISPR-associated protein Csc2|uniref:Type I-D CRISPR-associated protein Cas7/Csc2 n=1 Tax=Phormidium tenue FACHB-1050 TaxID=2692857 RepID=A0ABR8CGQ4_9CYAN|nr:type I-D CRISPR-associated protein Cas7/Csc2 [Phormidium tenue]MBD2319498.1 type I-D CRISPR-associated protein Cas7/Csc2 [Phormidium tenue FACHB-1050]